MTTSPSALAEVIAARARAAGALLLVTDYDGTLAPIAATPDRARPVPVAVHALQRLLDAAPGGVAVRVAVVTSRSCADLRAHLPPLPGLVMIGSAGLERLEGDTVDVLPAVRPWVSALRTAARELETALDAGRIPGARLEEKGCGVVVHTRGAQGGDSDAAALALVREVGGRTGLRPVAGKHAAELRPPIDIDKGTAVATLLEEAPPGTALVTAGDDRPDLPMLRLAARRDGGVAVAVADVETPEAVREAATDVVDGPWAWAQALTALADRLVAVGRGSR